uniref:Peptidase S1 domain-containing protein n=1 Tax=Stomoxys calcitrans TaxID=35570 RepID=A0A1I8PFC6_STOCA
MVMIDSFEILNSSRCGELPVDRVAGGTETGIDEYPWMALLRYDSPGDQFKCGGSLITNQFVLTAAHCVNERYGLIGVRLGEHDLNTDEDCVLKGPILDCNPPVEDYGIGEIFQHNYSYRRFTNDIALIKLNRKVEFKKHIKPVCLPITPDAIKPNNDDGYFLAGFGVTEKGVQSNVLLKAHVDHLPLSKCEDRFAISISQRMHLCAGDLVTGRDNCRGDSGGPLMRFSKYKKVKRFIQYGIIVAGGTVCDLCKALPGIYTNVLNYMPWITHKIVL